METSLNRDTTAGGPQANARGRAPRFSLRSLLIAIAVFAFTIAILDPRTRIEGHVVYSETGEPVVRAEVRAQPVDRSERRFSWGARAVTDENGRYVLRGLLRGRYNIFVKAERGWVAVAHDSFEAQRRWTNAEPIHLVKGALIKGQLVDVDTGSPVQVGNRVTIRVGMHGPSRPRSGAAIESAIVRPDGSFDLRVAPGENYLYLSGPGPYKAKGPYQLTFSQAGYAIQAVEGETIPLDFAVQTPQR